MPRRILANEPVQCRALDQVVLKFNPPRKQREVSHINDIATLFGSIPACDKYLHGVFFSEGRDQINSHAANYRGPHKSLHLTQPGF